MDRRKFIQTSGLGLATASLMTLPTFSEDMDSTSINAGTLKKIAAGLTIFAHASSCLPVVGGISDCLGGQIGNFLGGEIGCAVADGGSGGGSSDGGGNVNDDWAFLRRSGTGGGDGPGAGCFVGGTPVRLADGSLKPIEHIEMGDMILGFDGQPAGVTKTYIRETDHLRELRYRDNGGHLYRVETTDEHMYWVQNKQEWVPAGELGVGDELALPEGRFATIESTVRRAIDTVVYNFDVDGLQSYYANGALVYQQCGAETDPEVTRYLLDSQNKEYLFRSSIPSWQDNNSSGLFDAFIANKTPGNIMVGNTVSEDVAK